MLRGANKVTNAIALAVESALPFNTSTATGWREVTSVRKAICLSAARAAVTFLDEADYAIVAKPKAT